MDQPGDAGQQGGSPDHEPPRSSAAGGATPLSYASSAQDGQTDPKKQWWDDPRLPWQGKPTRADRWCWGAFILIGVYGLIMVPLRFLILGHNIYLAAVINGAGIAMIDIGADLRAALEPRWWLWLVIAALSVIKFDWVFWWAGKLWGHSMIEVMGGRSKWAARMGRHAERLASRFGPLATFLVWLIPFIPSAVVYAFVGSAGMKLRTFLLVDYLGALTNRAIYLYLGYRIGEPAKEVVQQVVKFSTWITIALIVVIVVNSARSARSEAGRAAS